MVLVDQPHHIHNQHIVILVLRVIELLPGVDCLQELLLSLGLGFGKGQLGDVLALSVVAVYRQILHLEFLPDQGRVRLLLRPVHEYLLVIRTDCVHL